jgi:hypothetical protein
MKLQILVILSVLAFETEAQQSWTFQRTNPYGNKYGYLTSYNSIGKLCKDYNPAPPIIMNYDAAGNRILRYPLLLDEFKTKKDALNDIAIGNISEKIISEEAIPNASEIFVFPNSTTESITVKQQAAIKKGQLELYNSKGKLIIQQSANESTTIEMGEFPSGIYLLVLRVGKATTQWKISKI